MSTASAENSMFDRSSEKLYRIKERLEELIAELDALLKEAQEISDTEPAQNRAANDSEMIRQVAEQREVLAAVVEILTEATADMPTLGKSHQEGFDASGCLGPFDSQ